MYICVKNGEAGAPWINGTGDLRGIKSLHSKLSSIDI